MKLLKLITLELIILFTSVVSSNSQAYWMDVETSAYTSYESGGITASGDYPYEGGVACNFLPLGTRVQIDGYWYVVNDRCGIDGVVDIYMDSYDRAINYGRCTKSIYVEE